MKNFEQIQIGDIASFSKKITEKDIIKFGIVSEDFNPLHFDRAYAKNTIFGDIIAHGMYIGSLISNVLGNQLPGPGAVYISQEMNFLAPAYIGDNITAKVEVIGKEEKRYNLKLRTTCTNQEDKKIIVGLAKILFRTK